MSHQVKPTHWYSFTGFIWFKPSEHQQELMGAFDDDLRNQMTNILISYPILACIFVKKKNYLGQKSPRSTDTRDTREKLVIRTENKNKALALAYKI